LGGIISGFHLGDEMDGRNNMAKRMTPGQIAKAQKLADEWKRK
jgi:hypothetical protein